MGEEEKEKDKKETTSGGEASNNVEESGNNNNKKEEMIIIKVDMHCHCEACAKKILKSLTTFQGVEDVAVDRKTNMVAIKGKTADPLKICDRIHHKTGRKAILLSPLPTPVQPQPQDQPKDALNQQPPKDQPPPVVTVVLGVHMHCEACAQLLRKRIRKMKGVESVETDVSKSQVIVKGVIADPEILVKYVHKRTRKQVTIIKDNQEEEKEEEKKQESSSSEQEKKGEEDKKEKGEDNKEGIKNIIDDAKMMMMMGDMNRYDYYWPSARYDYTEYHHHNNLNYQPQMPALLCRLFNFLIKLLISCIIIIFIIIIIV